MNGWTQPIDPRAHKGNLIALRDYLLSIGMKESAAAVDNVIDIMPIEAKRLDSQPVVNEDLGTRVIISGGEVLELSEVQNGEKIPF